MIVVKCEQGSDTWIASRAGVITASMFVVARSRTGGLTSPLQQAFVDAYRGRAANNPLVAAELAGYRNAKVKAAELMANETIIKALRGEAVGDFSEAAKHYAFRLAIERISGEPLDEGFQTYAMKRGHDLEPAARREHEIQTGVTVQRTGFVLTEDRLFGASADGLIGRDGGSEYKCLISPEFLRDVLLYGDFAKFMDQVQGCMWITGRRWWDFCLYCPALEKIGKHLWHRRVQRDDAYIENLVADLAEFEKLVSNTEALLRRETAA